MPPSFIRNLTERRVPQYLAIYLGAAWGLVQFVDFIGTRYALSPRWTDLALITMALLLPSVLLYTYHHGRPGPDAWQKSEKIFIPLNIVGLVAVLTLVGAGSNLSALTTRVKVKDEKGNTIERVVVNKAYRKRVALFPFDPAEGTAAWLSVAAPLLTQFDLQQQQFIQPVPTINMQAKLREAGFKDGVGVPLTLKRDLASERHIPQFLTGTVQQTATGVTVKVQLYETATAKLMSEHTFTAPTMSDVADMISSALLKDLDVPVLSDAKPDLPVAELTTQNPQALRDCFEALRLIVYKNDYRGAKVLLDNAARIDPTFAWLQVQRYAVNTALGAQPEAMAAIQSAMDHAYRLPERTQQYVKVVYYEARQDYPHAFAVLDMLSQLYPDDLEVLEQKVDVSRVRDNKDAEIAALKKILELDPTRSEKILLLGQVYEQRGDADNALAQYQSYAKRFPNEAGTYRLIANLYSKTGDQVKARAAFEQALLVKPTDVETLIAFAGLERLVGDFAAARDKLGQAMVASRSAQDTSIVLNATADLQSFTGEIKRSIETAQSALALAAKFQPPLQIVWSRLTLASRYAKIDPAKAISDVTLLRKQIGPQLDLFAPVVELDVYWEQQDSAKEEQSALALDQTIAKTSMALFKQLSLQGHGRAAELRGDCTGAIRWYSEVKKLAPLDVDIDTEIGRCYRKLGNTAEAQKALNSVLRVMPADGAANLELALLYQQSKDVAKAKQHAAAALKTWQNADPNFKPAKQAAAI